MMGGGMMGPFDPNAPPGAPGGPPLGPPSAWQAALHSLHGAMSFAGRLSFLVDENTHALHFFISALLQLFDRAGSLYGELARFVLRLLGLRIAAKGGAPGEPPKVGGAPPGTPQHAAQQQAAWAQAQRGQASPWASPQQTPPWESVPWGGAQQQQHAAQPPPATPPPAPTN